METVQIRDQGWKKVGSGINIPDPQHCFEGKELLPVAVPVLCLLQCCGILHTQQQAAQQHLGVRRLHFHLKSKDDIQNRLNDCAAASCTLSSRQPSSIWVFAGSTSTSKAKTTIRTCFTTVPRHPARSAAGSPAASGCSPAPLPPQKQRRHLEHALRLCRERFRTMISSVSGSGYGSSTNKNEKINFLRHISN